MGFSTGGWVEVFEVPPPIRIPFFWQNPRIPKPSQKFQMTDKSRKTLVISGSMARCATHKFGGDLGPGAMTNQDACELGG